MVLDSQPSGTTTIGVSPSGSSDVSVAPSTLILTPATWDTGATVLVSAAHDADLEDDTADIGHYPVIGYGPITVADVSVRVIDDDVVRPVSVSFGQSSYSVSEGSDVDIEVSLSEPAGRAVEVPLTATPQNGATGDDYSGVPASVTFGASDTRRSFTFSALSDSDEDDGESVELGFGTMPEGVTLGNTTQATVTIGDTGTSLRYEGPTVSVSATPAVIQVPGGDRTSTTTITASIDRPSGAETTVTVSTSPSSATWMYLSANSELVIPAGSSTSTGVVTITALNDESFAGHRVIAVEGAWPKTAWESMGRPP